MFHKLVPSRSKVLGLPRKVEANMTNYDRMLMRITAVLVASFFALSIGDRFLGSPWERGYESGKRAVQFEQETREMISKAAENMKN